MNKTALIIDDNKRYTAMLRERLERTGFAMEHKLSSQDGREHLMEGDANRYGAIITDITMETQVSGILLTYRIRKMGYKGCLIIYSTGFNTAVGMWASAALFKILGADGLIAKDRLKAGVPKMVRLSKHEMLEEVDKALQ